MKLKLTDILEGIPEDCICKAILAKEPDEPEMADFDFEDAQRLCWRAAEKWLLRDLDEFTLLGVEEEAKMQVGHEELVYVTDISGRIQGNHNPFRSYTGQKYVIDWKTSRNTLGTDWKDRLLRSWQWRIYGAGTQSDIFIYRGLSRNGETREVIIDIPPTNDTEVYEFLRGIHKTLKSLNDFPVWPRNMPFACNAYGRECEFLQDCQNYTMPKASASKRLSYSYIQTYLLCPEKARRYALAKGAGGYSEETTFGRSVHRGLAELWRRAFERI